MGGNRNGFRERPKDASRARPKATPDPVFQMRQKVQKRGPIQVGDNPGAALVLVLAFALEAAAACRPA